MLDLSIAFKVSIREKRFELILIRTANLDITDIPTDFNNGSKKLNVPESDKPMIVADTEAAKGKPREVETEKSFEKSDEKDQDEG